MANSVCVSSTGYRLRSSLRSSSGARVSGGENSPGGKPPAPALDLRAATCTGSETEARLAHTPACQPLGDSERVRTLRFSEIVHVFEPSGEDYFDKEALIQLRKSQEQPFKNEDYTQSRQAVQEALSSRINEGEGLKNDEGRRHICGNGRCTEPRCRGHQCTGKPRQKQPLQHTGF